MAVPQHPQNTSLVNRAAHNWLLKAKESAPPDELHLLTLAMWGLDNGAEGDWPTRNRSALRSQTEALLGWPAEDALGWLFSNPEGPSPKEQEDDLLHDLHAAAGQKEAAAYVLNSIYSRQESQNSALQLAANES